MKHDSNQPGQEDFAALFEQSLSGMTSYKSGQMVETCIQSISGDTIFLELNGKSEGVLSADELKNKEGELTVKVGDPIRAYFLDGRNGELRFTTRIGGENAGSAMLEQAWQNRIPVEGQVEKEIKGGYEIRIGSSRAFCPHSQMGDRRGGSPADYVGKTLQFRITEYKEGGRNILVSNRVFHEEARQASLAELKASLNVGDVIKGSVVSIQSYGAFIDLGGLQALLPASEISRQRVESVAAVLKVGQEVEARIIKLDWQSERISLSMKDLEADPWTTISERYPIGSHHTGTVARLTKFGAFVSLEPGIDGLVHISEIRSANDYGSSSELSVKQGQTLQVEVLEIDVSKQRIGLRPLSEADRDGTSQQYLNKGGDTETYNPFAALLKQNK